MHQDELIVNYRLVIESDKGLAILLQCTHSLLDYIPFIIPSTRECMQYHMY
jgi:hypothetical protein